MFQRAMLCSAVAFISLAIVQPCHGDTLTVEVIGGSAINLPSPLVVHQDGFPDIRVSSAHYDTKPLGPYFPYYSWRLGLWDGDSAWELQHIHHRLYLTNPPPEIQFFAIHFGYNYFLVGRAWKHDGFVYRVGAGPILTNPENTGRDRKFRSEPPGLLDRGNFFSGIGTQVAIQRNVQLTDHLFLLGEGTFTAGFAWRVPVADGMSNVPNRALHWHLGVGVSF